MKVFKRIISIALSLCMMLSLVSFTYASDNQATYEALFQAQKEIVDEINAEYGMELSITPLEGAAEEDLSQINLVEFRSFLTAHAEKQQQLRALEEEAANNDSTIMVPYHGTFLTPRLYSQTHGVIWDGWGTFVLASQISVDVYQYNGFAHAHAARFSQVSYVANSATIPGFLHYKTGCLSVRVEPDERYVTATFISDVAFSFMLTTMREPALLSSVTYNIW